MNCIKHQDIAVVAMCENCGVGLCADCVNASEYRLDNKPLCRECNFKMANDVLADNRSKKGKLLFKLVLNGVFLLLGSIVMLTSKDGMTTGLVLFALGGVPTA